MIADARDHTVAVDPVQIARSYGIKVRGRYDLEPDISGQIFNKDGQIIIEYNKKDSLMRQRFTIAHELGHYLSGHLREEGVWFRDTSKNYSKENYDLQEVEANKKAAQILMPKKQLEKLVFDEGNLDISELARIFQVSETAMLYRLKNLGWVS